MDKDDATKRSLRQSAVEEAQTSIAAYGREAQPEPKTLSESYSVLGTAQELLGFTFDTMDVRTRFNKEAIASTEKALELHPENRDAIRNLERFRKTESVNTSAENDEKQKSGAGMCFRA